MINALKTTIAGLFLLALLTLSGCAEHIYSDAVKGVNYKLYKTFAILPDADISHQDGRINNSDVNHGIMQDVIDEMTLRGFKLDTVRPDLLILVHTFLKQKNDTIRTPILGNYPYYYSGANIGPWYPFYYPYYYNIPNIVGYNIHPVTYEDGSIAVDVIERSSNKIIWRAWAEENEFDPQQLTDQIRHKVAQVFNRFPVKEQYNSSNAY